MFCSQCGKKVMENMLFCPFCGSPIVIPDQGDGDAAAEVKQEFRAVGLPSCDKTTEAVKTPEAVHVSEEPEEKAVPAEPEKRPMLDIEQADPAEFKPLDLDAIAVSEPIEEQPLPEEPKAEETREAEISELLSSQLRQEAVRLEGHAPDLTAVRPPKTAQKKKRNTYAPVREFNPNDIFLDGGDDEYDDYEKDSSYEYEEPEEGGFFVRHIRGLVALGMMVILLAVVGGWAISEQGQLSLARSNLAWRPSAYQKLGYQAYQDGNYLLAGQYYSQALARDDTEYSFATSACVSYYTGGNMEKATEMARRAIEIDASELEAYSILLRIYPNPENRPWEITSLLQQGYRITGDSSLNVE